MVDSIKNAIFQGLITDVRHCLHLLMGLAVLFVILAGYILRDHLHEVAGKSQPSSTLYDNDIYSRLFHGGIEFTLIVSLPTIIDMTLSVIHLQTWQELQQPIEFARRYIFTVIFVPNCFIYWKLMPAALIDLIMFFQYLLVFYTLIYRIHTLSISQQKSKVIQAHPLRDLFINCIATMTMGFCYKLSTHGFLPNKLAWKTFYTAFLLLLQILTCLKLKPWFNFTWQLTKVVKNNALLENKIAFYSLMAGILTCTVMSLVDAITFKQAYIYFPASENSFIAVEWIFCVLLLCWTSVRNYEILKFQLAATVSICISIL